MHFRLIKTIYILLAMVSVSMTDSDFTWPYTDFILPSTDSNPEQTSLPFDQTELSYNLLDLTVDQITPIWDAEDSSTDSFEGLNLSGNSDVNLSETLWDDSFELGDSFELVDCSGSEYPPALGKPRVRRFDDSSRCPNAAVSGAPPDTLIEPLQMLPQAYDKERHSLTCFEMTSGLLPVAVLSTDEPNDISLDTTRKYRLPNQIYEPVTIYRATICMERNLISMLHDLLRADMTFSNRRRIPYDPRRGSLLLSIHGNFFCVYDGS